MKPPRAPGQMLAPGYIVDEHLSRGNALDIYSVYSLERACLCIAKVVCNQSDAHADQARLREEGRMLTRLTHPHLVRGYEVLDAGPCATTILVMEMLTGATLSRVVADHGALGAEDVALLGQQLCSVLHYLHGQGILHLDLKPSNIICEAGQARVLDLSLAQAPGTCRAGAGTYEYMAPEQVAGGNVGPATDVWGLGGVLYRALTRLRPFLRTETPRDPQDRPDLDSLKQATTDPRLCDMVTSCFELEPARRPGIANISEVLSSVLTGESHPPVSGQVLLTS